MILSKIFRKCVRLGRNKRIHYSKKKCFYVSDLLEYVFAQVAKISFFYLADVSCLFPRTPSSHLKHQTTYNEKIHTVHLIFIGPLHVWPSQWGKSFCF